MGMKVPVVVFWVLVLCGDVVGYQHFGGPYYLYLQGAILFKLGKGFFSVIKSMYFSLLYGILYILPSLIVNNLTYCPQNIFMGFI
jgi:hypothetical protein